MYIVLNEYCSLAFSNEYCIRRTVFRIEYCKLVYSKDYIVIIYVNSTFWPTATTYLGTAPLLLMIVGSSYIYIYIYIYIRKLHALNISRDLSETEQTNLIFFYKTRERIAVIQYVCLWLSCVVRTCFIYVQSWWTQLNTALAFNSSDRRCIHNFSK